MQAQALRPQHMGFSGTCDDDAFGLTKRDERADSIEHPRNTHILITHAHPMEYWTANRLAKRKVVLNCDCRKCD